MGLIPNCDFDHYFADFFDHYLAKIDLYLAIA